MSHLIRFAIVVGRFCITDALIQLASWGAAELFLGASIIVWAVVESIIYEAHRPLPEIHK